MKIKKRKFQNLRRYIFIFAIKCSMLVWFHGKAYKDTLFGEKRKRRLTPFAAFDMIVKSFYYIMLEIIIKGGVVHEFF